ncbi:MAG: glycosyltransferase family 9 protein [Acidisphaera sp.]|nr:glycosyltransferase family 9 protein [Acidisphaera sp.]
MKRASLPTHPVQPSRKAEIVVRDFGAPARPRRRILVVKLDHFGDFIIALPAFERLRRAFPRDHIALVCGPWNAAGARDSGLFDEVRTYTFFPENVLAWDCRPIEELDRFRAAAAGRYDLAIDLRVDEDTRHLLEHVDAEVKCGIGGRGRFPFLDVILPPEPETRSNPFGTVERGLLIPPDRFRSRMPIVAPFYEETDFSFTDTYLTDGPDIELPRGRYRAIFGLRVVRGPCLLGASVTIEVVRNAEELVVRRQLKRRRHIGMARSVIEFSAERNGSRYEFRIHTGGRAPAARLRFIGVWLEQLNDGDVRRVHSRFRPAELHVGEKLSMLVELVEERTRALYADDMLPARVPPGAAVEAELRRIPPGAQRIVLAPISNSSVRDWPIDNYAALAGRLLATGERRILLLGAPAQADRLARITQGNAGDPRIIDLSGKTKWPELPDILRRADLVICNNSGIAHLAAACGVRTLAIYSGSHLPQEWGPRGVASRTIVAAVPCSPCGFDRLQECRFDHRCMHEITPDIVLAQAEQMLGAALQTQAAAAVDSGSAA